MGQCRAKTYRLLMLPRVEVIEAAAAPTGVVVVTPSGFRIEGLDATAAATLIRQLA